MGELVLIAAVATNSVIGVANALPWHLPADLRRFRSLTLGHPVVMGRRTYASIGNALAGRTNVVLSRDRSFDAIGCTVCPDVESALDAAAVAEGSDEVYVIGGATLYAQTIDDADRLELTLVDACPPGDANFPAVDPRRWAAEVNMRHDADDDHAFAFEFRTYTRR